MPHFSGYHLDPFTQIATRSSWLAVGIRRGSGDLSGSSSISELNSRIASAVAGDTIIVSNGVYTTTSSIAVTKVGTAAKPIMIQAQSIGGVEIRGSHGFNLNNPRGLYYRPGIQVYAHECAKHRHGHEPLPVYSQHDRTQHFTHKHHFLHQHQRRRTRRSTITNCAINRPSARCSTSPARAVRSRGGYGCITIISTTSPARAATARRRFAGD